LITHASFGGMLRGFLRATCLIITMLPDSLKSARHTITILVLLGQSCKPSNLIARVLFNLAEFRVFGLWKISKPVQLSLAISLLSLTNS